MFIRIDYSSGEPISHQVVAQIKWMVVSGRFKSGDQLPSIRELARQLNINPTTVTRIYDELQHSGVITLRQGQGAFICEHAHIWPVEEVEKLVAKQARAMLVEGLRLGLTKKQIDQLVNEEFRRIRMAKNE